MSEQRVTFVHRVPGDQWIGAGPGRRTLMRAVAHVGLANWLRDAQLVQAGKVVISEVPNEGDRSMMLVAECRARAK